MKRRSIFFRRLRAALRTGPRLEFLPALAAVRAERGRRLAAVGAVLFVTVCAAGLRPALLAVAAIGTVELTLLLIERAMPNGISLTTTFRATDRHASMVSSLLVLAFWVTVTLGAGAYHVPAILLAGQSSVPLMLGGLLWIFGFMAHVAIGYGRLSGLLLCQLMPGFVSAGLLLVAARQNGGPGAPPLDWLLTFGLLLLACLLSALSILSLSGAHRVLRAKTYAAEKRLERLEYRHQHDGLTGLLTRQALDSQLVKVLNTYRQSTGIVVFAFDLDGFKPINDSYSHAAGDAVLIAVAARMRASAPPDALVSRLGGDEFAIACLRSTISGDLGEFCEQVLKAIEQPIVYEGRALRVGASLGIAASNAQLHTPAALCRAADQAMMHCKGRPGVRYTCYGSEDIAPRPTLDDRHRLQLALANGEIIPFYQPKVHLLTGAVCGFEALARWHHPTRGLLEPAHFIPMINDLGLQGDFLTAVARIAFQDLSTLLTNGQNPGRFSINIPEVTLATYSGRAELDRLLDDYPATLPYLTFEITEDVFISRSGSLIQASIAHFRGRGVRIALDDFGTGFASFQHLRELEFDELKIDRSFVQGLGDDIASEVLVDGFLSIANGLGVDVVAEGVETEAQRQRLLSMGARVAQGWLFGKAAPFAQIRTMLHHDSSAVSLG